MTTLNPSQAEAMEVLWNFTQESDEQLAALSGSAGTGKTFLTGALVLRAQQAGMRVAVTAPTNKAVRVLREKVAEVGAVISREPATLDRADFRRSEIGFGSIHSFLGLRVTENEDGSQSCVKAGDAKLFDLDLLVVDEASMIGHFLFKMITDELEENRHLSVLFVGDPAQLPPIEQHEAVSPTFTEAGVKVHLTEIVRQAKGSPIIHLSVAVRQAIETKKRVDPAMLQRSLTELEQGALPSEVTILRGGNTKILELLLAELENGTDVRVLAYMNRSVLYYNQHAHAALYGKDATLFMPGERFLVHTQCKARRVIPIVDANGKLESEFTMVTNEEGVVLEVEPHPHPHYSQTPALRLKLRVDDGTEVIAYVAVFPEAVEGEIAVGFDRWRRLKAEGNQEVAKEASSRAWALRKAFAPLRHVYAMTNHKVQGSTIDSAILDFGNIERMQSDFAFNRAVYVAMTRPRYSLYVVHG